MSRLQCPLRSPRHPHRLPVPETRRGLTERRGAEDDGAVDVTDGEVAGVGLRARHSASLVAVSVLHVE
jgi:hypothetical protein